MGSFEHSWMPTKARLICSHMFSRQTAEMEFERGPLGSMCPVKDSPIYQQFAPALFLHGTLVFSSLGR